MVTAAHCGDIGQGWYTTDQGGGDSSFEGYMRLRSTRQDAAGLNGGQSYGNYVATGPYNGTSREPVTAFSNLGVGARICYSGSFSGQVCGNQIYYTGISVNYPGGYTVYGLTETGNIYGVAGAGEGDSGGPAIIANSSGQTVLGMIDGIDTTYSATCQGDSSYNRPCATRVFYEPASSIAAAFGATLG